jgi:hypothetical protein
MSDSPTASACFLRRNAASIAGAWFTRCTGPNLLSMNVHQHQFSLSGQRAVGVGLGRLVMRVLIRVAVVLLIAIPLFLVVVTAFARVGRSPAIAIATRSKPVTS